MAGLLAVEDARAKAEKKEGVAGIEERRPGHEEA